VKSRPGTDAQSLGANVRAGIRPARGPAPEAAPLSRRIGAALLPAPLSVGCIRDLAFRVRERTAANLKSAGYQGWAGLSLNPGGLDTVPYKSGERVKIEQNGYEIIANVGDQYSDLAGGHADVTYKLANPFYFLP